ncbi:hypothetical protein [Perigonia lusca single nucleopolyhedrovirus]|uniref:Uncharacterized protein n=1 Tax=Perigonia lusca single nucleopolyhedrovirus TaxID=1675865 RepID=A0A0M3WN09_9ABAC|nr:hypothetical protein [Perigonia lusca single nucleopolyhedrovirus]AKN80575.1 hypothetical protein [Perigonia lusca single nucleopolyhedrovirus]
MQFELAILSFRCYLCLIVSWNLSHGRLNRSVPLDETWHLARLLIILCQLIPKYFKKSSKNNTQSKMAD